MRDVLTVGSVIAAVLVLCWIIQRWSESRCQLCRFGRATLERGDYRICRLCWEAIERDRRIQEAIASKTAQDEIDAWEQEQARQREIVHWQQKGGPR